MHSQLRIIFFLYILQYSESFLPIIEIIIDETIIIAIHPKPSSDHNEDYGIIEFFTYMGKFHPQWGVYHHAVAVPMRDIDVLLETHADSMRCPATIDDIFYYLYTSKDDEFTDHLIDPSNPTKIRPAKNKIYFLIHGWTQNKNSTPWYKPLTAILLEKCSDAYVIQVDWSKRAAGIYPIPAFTTDSVGKVIGDFIYTLVKDYNKPSKNIILIGHSLGGHVAGWTGKRYFKLSQSKLPRIIGLDPAGPLYEVRPTIWKLSKNDAQVVMVIHINGGNLGHRDKCGTIDFFPNGGSWQPNCPDRWCHHRRAYQLFVEAVQFPQSFMAKKCPGYDEFKKNKCEDIEVSLGDLETSQTGNFFLDTNHETRSWNEELRLGKILQARKPRWKVMTIKYVYPIATL